MHPSFESFAHMSQNDKEWAVDAHEIPCTFLVSFFDGILVVVVVSLGKARAAKHSNTNTQHTYRYDIYPVSHSRKCMNMAK